MPRQVEVEASWRFRRPWLLASGGALAAAIGLIILGLNVFKERPRVIEHGPRDRPEIALTFDADMTRAMAARLKSEQVRSWYDPAIVRELQETGTPATFFVTGLWAMTYPDTKPARDLADGQVVSVGGVELTVLHTPGHAPGAVCLYAPDLATVFSGDTLFQGGPGATGRSSPSAPSAERRPRRRDLHLRAQPREQPRSRTSGPRGLRPWP